MIVYRICNKDEINLIFHDKSFHNVGNFFEINKNANTHLYKNNKKYIHFFRDFKNIFYLDTTPDMFICTYDIPNYLLEKHYGEGFYLDYFNFKNLQNISEYAIENEFINFNYLLKIDKILEFIDIEDYMYGDIESKLETIYLKLSNQKKYEKILKLYNILTNSNVKESITSNLNYLIELIPETKSTIGFDHKHPHHHLDVWQHTLYALSLSEKDFDIRLTLLLHDIGKPFSFTEENGIRHFHNHPLVSAKMSKNILTRLGFCDEYINRICYLIELHDTPITKQDINDNYDLIFTRYLIQKYDALAHNPEKLENRKKYLECTKKLIFKK